MSQIIISDHIQCPVGRRGWAQGLSSLNVKNIQLKFSNRHANFSRFFKKIRLFLKSNWLKVIISTWTVSRLIWLNCRCLSTINKVIYLERKIIRDLSVCCGLWMLSLCVCCWQWYLFLPGSKVLFRLYRWWMVWDQHLNLMMYNLCECWYLKCQTFSLQTSALGHRPLFNNRGKKWLWK